MGLLSTSDLARIPAEPPRQPALLPGLRLSRAFSKAALVFPLALAAFFALILTSVASQDRDAQLALRKTVTTSGRIESAEPSRGCGGGATELVYSFVSGEGVAFRARASVCSQSAYARLHPGDPVPIVYVAANPAVSAIAGERHPDPGAFVPFVVFPLFPLVFFLPLFWPRISQLRADRRLFRTGALAKGRVVFASRRLDSVPHGWAVQARSEVFVSARLRSGEEREVKATCTNDWLLAHLPPGAEVDLCVAGDRAVLLDQYVR